MAPSGIFEDFATVFKQGKLGASCGSSASVSKIPRKFLSRGLPILLNSRRGIPARPYLLGPFS